MESSAERVSHETREQSREDKGEDEERKRPPPLRAKEKEKDMLSVSDAEKLVHAFMTSRLDYCNALLDGCPASSINKLQIVQNAAARVLTRSRKYDHITPMLQSLHWLPIKFRISYKILLLAYKALNDLAPAYLTNLLSRYNPTRSLRNTTLDSW